MNRRSARRQARRGRGGALSHRRPWRRDAAASGAGRASRPSRATRQIDAPNRVTNSITKKLLPGAWGPAPRSGQAVAVRRSGTVRMHADVLSTEPGDPYAEATTTIYALAFAIWECPRRRKTQDASCRMSLTETILPCPPQISYFSLGILRVAAILCDTLPQIQPLHDSLHCSAHTRRACTRVKSPDQRRAESGAESCQ
jgi:hypothetical protein